VKFVDHSENENVTIKQCHQLLDSCLSSEFQRD
jgi:hypothetical protein